MTPVEELLAERIRDVERWAADHPDTPAAVLIYRDPPVPPGQVVMHEHRIKHEDPTGLPARCDSCGIRMPMCDRHKSRHPKCSTPGTTPSKES